MPRRFVIVSGLPGSGKTTLARRLAPALGLQLIDKDDILERLFESRGAGDAATRRALSRESDAILRNEAEASAGAVLVSFWHVAGMPADSGTPSDWIAGLAAEVVHVQCVCPSDIAAARFLRRPRHPGHLDQESTEAEIRARIGALATLPELPLEPQVRVDTAGTVDVEEVARMVRQAQTRAASASGRIACDIQ